MARCGKFLYCCLTLSLLLPYFSPASGALFPRDPLNGLGTYPFSTSVLDRQVNQPDTILFTSKTRGDGPFLENCSSDRISTSNRFSRSSRTANSSIIGNTSYSSRTCLQYSPLLPIPPPRS